jgi:hypothetical protein
MKSSGPEIKCLADSIPDLVTAIIEFIKMHVQDATQATGPGGAVDLPVRITGSLSPVANVNLNHFLFK